MALCLGPSILYLRNGVPSSSRSFRSSDLDPLAYRFEPDGQGFQRVQSLQRSPLRLVHGELQIGQSDECGERGLGLGSGEGGAEAVVGADAKGHVATGVAGDVEGVG